MVWVELFFLRFLPFYLAVVYLQWPISSFISPGLVWLALLLICLSVFCMSKFNFLGIVGWFLFVSVLSFVIKVVLLLVTCDFRNCMCCLDVP